MKSEKIIYLVLIILAVITPGTFYYFFFLTAFLLLLFKNIKAFKFVTSKSFIFLTGLLLFVHPLLAGGNNISLLGINYSLDSSLTGLQMIMRAVIIIPSIKLLFRNLSAGSMNNFWKSLGLTHFDSAFSISKKIMPVLKSTTNNYFGKMSRTKRKQLLTNPVEFIARFLAVLLTSHSTTDEKNYKGTTMKNLMFFLMALLVSSNIYGQTTDTIPAYNLGEVIITAKNENIVKASSIIEVDSEQIQRSLASTVTDAVGFESGIRTQVNSKGETPFYIRGFSQKQIAVFIDGIPVYFPYEGDLDLNQIPAASIEKITISKGMPSILYGPNSMGGTINIVTKENKEGFGFNANLRTGSADGISLNTRGEFLNLKWNINGQYDKSSGYFLSKSFNNTVNEDGGRRENSQHENLGGTLRLTFSPLPKVKFSYSMFLSSNSRGVPPEIYTNRPRFWKYTEWKKYLHNLAVNILFDESLIIKGNLFYDKYRNVLDSYDDDIYSTQTQKYAFHSIYNDDSRGLNINSIIKLNFIPLTKLVLMYKKDVHREQSNIGQPIGEYRAETITVGAEQEYNFNHRLAGVAAIGYDSMNPLFANNAPLRRSCLIINGHAGLNYLVNDWINVHAHISKKSRFPTLKEFYSEVLGRNIANPDLSAERSMNYELGFELKLVSYSPLKINFFFSDVKDMIQLVNLPDAMRQFQNIGKVQLAGFETELGINASIFESKINYTFLSAENLAADAKNRILDNRPKHVLNMINLKNYPMGFEWLIEASFVSSRYSINGDTGEFIEMPDYFLLNVKLSQKFFGYYTLAAGITNILDKYYESEYGFPQPGREYILNLSVSL